MDKLSSELLKQGAEPHSESYTQNVFGAFPQCYEVCVSKTSHVLMLDAAIADWLTSAVIQGPTRARAGRDHGESVRVIGE